MISNQKRIKTGKIKTFIIRFAEKKIAVISLFIFIIILLVTIFAPSITDQDPEKIDFFSIEMSPSDEHLLGTDSSGRDVFARVLYGGRISMLIAFSSTLIQLLIGVSLGLIVGYYSSFVDMVLARIMDIIMCFPFFVLALAITSVVGASATNLVVIIGFLLWPGIAKIVRTRTLTLKNNDYILAAKVMGFNDFEIITKYIFPNIISQVMVTTVLSVANGILLEASLSFLGLGVVSIPSWGNMLSSTENLLALERKWWLWLPAGIMIVLTVLSINFIGEGIKHATSNQNINI